VAGIEFRILGPLELAVDGHVVPLGSGRQRTLLALLLLSRNEPVSAQRLVDRLWADGPPDSALKALQNYISQLRKLVGPDALVTTPGGYMLRVGRGDVDADRLEQRLDDARSAPPEVAVDELREALSWWRGPPLPELADEEFARAEVGRLEELRVRAIEARIETELTLGRHAEVVAELESLVSREPLRERLRAQLMLALYRCGRQADALAVYVDTRRRLADELGLEPGEELKRLQRAILAHEPALDPPPAAVGEAPRRRGRAAVAVAALVVAGGATAAALSFSGRSTPADVPVAPNSLAFVETASNRVSADVPVGDGPVAVAVGAGAVWVANANDETVSRIDPNTKREVARIGVGTDESALAVGFGSVWVAGGNDGTLVRIDARTNVVRARLRLGHGNALAPAPVFAVAAGGGTVWATSGDSVVRVDPVTDAVTRRIPVDRPNGIAVAHGALWVTSTAARVLRFDAVTGVRTASIAVPVRAIAPVVANDSVWAVVESQPFRIWRLNAATAETDLTTSDPAFPVDLASAADAIFAANAAGTLWRLDDGGRIVARIRLGHEPTSVAAGDGGVWVAVERST
jgi:DNA-binding SARP family transcriptional activator